ncbi:MAG: cupin domain-containing protein [Saprospiraceae bacterium]|nr:cupin domain-containing protein [Saprospiraceae bacterium]
MPKKSFSKFVLGKDLPLELVEGRGHHWHYRPETTPEADTLMVKVVVQAGEGHDFHRHPDMHEILYVLKGTAEQWIENEKKILTVGDSIYLDPDVVHATFNAGNDVLEFLAILSPKAGWSGGTIDESQNLPYKHYRSQKS